MLEERDLVQRPGLAGAPNRRTRRMSAWVARSKTAGNETHQQDTIGACGFHRWTGELRLVKRGSAA